MQVNPFFSPTSMVAPAEGVISPSYSPINDVNPVYTNSGSGVIQAMIRKHLQQQLQQMLQLKLVETNTLKHKIPIIADDIAKDSVTEDSENVENFVNELMD